MRGVAEPGIGGDAGRSKAARNQPREARQRGGRTTNDLRVQCPRCDLVASPGNIGRHLKFRHRDEHADCECGWRFPYFSSRLELRARRLPAALAWHQANRCPLRLERNSYWCPLCTEWVGPLHDDVAHSRDHIDPLECPHAGCTHVAADVADRNRHALHECPRRTTCPT